MDFISKSDFTSLNGGQPNNQGADLLNSGPDKSGASGLGGIY